MDLRCEPRAGLVRWRRGSVESPSCSAGRNFEEGGAFRGGAIVDTNNLGARLL